MFWASQVQKCLKRCVVSKTSGGCSSSGRTGFNPQTSNNDTPPLAVAAKKSAETCPTPIPKIHLKGIDAFNCLCSPWTFGKKNRKLLQLKGVLHAWTN